jgi:hypothetical protein
MVPAFSQGLRPTQKASFYKKKDLAFKSPHIPLTLHCLVHGSGLKACTKRMVIIVVLVFSIPHPTTKNI